MYALIKNQQLIGIFTSKKKMKEICEAIIDDDYIDSGTYGWYHFRYIEFDEFDLHFYDCEEADVLEWVEKLQKIGVVFSNKEK